jgi:predicted nicotinamide N-methyase
MSEFVWHERCKFLNKTVLEVGAGTSLPSLVLGKYASSIQLILSDIPSILPVIHGCLELNEIDAQVRAIEWGTFGQENSVDKVIHEKIDVILGSDTFYDPSRKEMFVFILCFLTILIFRI